MVSEAGFAHDPTLEATIHAQPVILDNQDRHVQGHALQAGPVAVEVLRLLHVLDHVEALKVRTFHVHGPVAAGGAVGFAEGFEFRPDLFEFGLSAVGAPECGS